MDALPEKVRAFIALNLSAEVKDAVAGFISDLARLRSGVHWVPGANLHLTLRFLGAAVDSTMLWPLDKALAQIAAESRPLGVRLHGTGAFPSLARPRVLWIGLSSEQLGPLAHKIEAAVVGGGFDRESRPYSPHLTIGRVRDPRGWPVVRHALENAARREFGETRADSFVLYRSVLGSAAARYRVLGRYEFCADDVSQAARQASDRSDVGSFRRC